MSDSEGVWLKQAVITVTKKTVKRSAMFGRSKEETHLVIDFRGVGAEERKTFNFDDFFEGETLSVEIPGLLILDKEPGMKALEFLGRDTQITELKNKKSEFVGVGFHADSIY